MRPTCRAVVALTALALLVPTAPLAATAAPGGAPAPPTVLEVPADPSPPGSGHAHEATLGVATVAGVPTLVERVVVELRVPPARRTVKRFRMPGRVGLGRVFAVRGAVPTVRAGLRVKRQNRRVVVLQQQVGRRWVPIVRQRAAARGGFRIRVRGPAVPLLATLRVVAPNVRRVTGLPPKRARREARLLPRAASPRRTVGFGSPAQVRALRRANTHHDWNYLFPGPNPQLWQSCDIAWSHDPRGAYAGSAAHVRTAFRRVAGRSAFGFTEVPWAAGGDQAPVRLSWRTPAQDPRLAGAVVGYAYTSATATEIVDVDIVLDRATAGLRRGYAGRDGRTWGTVMVHELTHGIGLGHAVGDRQLMHPVLTGRNGVFGVGDVAGLGAVGVGCG